MNNRSQQKGRRQELKMFVYFVALALSAAASAKDELGANQLQQYLNEHKEPAGTLHTSYGYPVTYAEANLGINRDSNLLLNHYIYESLSSFSLERIPPRAVHPNGSGAKGYFEVTHDVSNVTNVKLFTTFGKKTPVFVRISTTTGDIGSEEVRNRGKGFAIKFYTEEGIMDLTGLSIDTFLVKDPVHTASLIHQLNQKNPRTGLNDLTLLWDFLINRPETIIAVTLPLTRIGQPKSYRHISGHAIHTYQVDNDSGETSFIRLNWLPDSGKEFLPLQEFQSITAVDPDYYTKDLYDAISNETYPSWTLCMQVIPKKDLEKVEFDIFDVTLSWPVDDYPNHPIGKFVLNKHVDNHFAETEQSAFNPGNLVPGIRGVDKIFESRIFIYRDTQIHRLGTGFNRIKINCPINNVQTYNRDGNPPMGNNGGDSPNYYPNSFNGIVPINRTLAPLHRPNTDLKATNMWQLTKLYQGLPEVDKTEVAIVVAEALARAPTNIQEKVINLYSQADSRWGADIKKHLTSLLTSASSV